MKAGSHFLGGIIGELIFTLHLFVNCEDGVYIRLTIWLKQPSHNLV